MADAKHTHWQFDRETGEHYLPVDDDKSWKVYKTSGGDYAMTLHSDAGGSGGEFEYFDTLAQAKRATIAKATGSAS